MRRRDLVDLVLLAALWGASFLFTRIAVPAFGPLALAELRVAIAAVMLVLLLAWRADLSELRSHARHFRSRSPSGRPRRSARSTGPPESRSACCAPDSRTSSTSA